MMVTSPIYCPIVDCDDDGDVVMMLMIIMPEPFPSVIPSLSRNLPPALADCGAGRKLPENNYHENHDDDADDNGDGGDDAIDQDAAVDHSEYNMVKAIDYI